jgi:predicted nucleotidyltransferase
MSQFGWHNCPAAVKRQIERLIDELRRELTKDLTGVYLHGSLATGCFNPLRSDIDMLVATRRGMSLEIKYAVARSILDASLHPAPVEISFLTSGDLHPWRHPTPYDFHYSEDRREKFERELAGGDWKSWNDDVERFDDDLAAHITVLNHRGVCLYGQPVAEVFPPVPEHDFVDSILADVLSAKFGLESAAAQFPVYVVLNACRTLAFLQTKRVLSKEEGGGWALDNLPAEFHQTIVGALDEYRRGRNDRSALTPENLVEFTAFIKNEIERAKQALKFL